METIKTGITQIDRVSQQVKAVRMTRVFPYAGKDEVRHKEAGLDLWYDISYASEGMSPAQVRNLYKTVPGISYAQRVVNYSLDGNPTFRPISPDDIARAQKAASTMPFNDPLLPDQWHYHNDGSLPGSMPGADINVFPAWEQGNTGSKDVVVAIIDGGILSKYGNKNFSNESKDVRITLPTDKSGNISDELTVNYADGKSQSIPVKAVVIGAPTVKVTPDNAELTAPYGGEANTTFNIANNGDEPLEVATKAADWYTFANGIDDEQSTVNYTYMASDDYADVKFDWVDILNDFDEHCNFAYFANTTDNKEVELPFEFPFYGKKYKKMYLYDTGFMQFTKPKEDYKMFPEPPASLPNGESFYRNILCPLWGNHSMTPYQVDGIYYKKFDDHVVVTFKNYGNSVMDGFNFQAILHKDGTVKFQYSLDPTGQLNGIFGIAGAQDNDAKRGFTIPGNYVGPGKAINVYPEFNYVIAPGKSVDMPIALDTKKIADTYDNVLSLATNDPQNKGVEIPVKLTAKAADMKALTASDSLKDAFRAYTFEPMAQSLRKAMAKVRKDDAYIWDDPIPGNDRTPDAPDHTNALYYPVMQPISNAKIAMLGAGESHVNDEFTAATRYTAPEEGFNLTHVFFVGTIGDLQNVYVEASVILGDNVALLNVERIQLD